MPLQIGCKHLGNAPKTHPNEGEAIWIGEKGEQPMEVWPKRDWVICDSTVYRCEKI